MNVLRSFLFPLRILNTFQMAFKAVMKNLLIFMVSWIPPTTGKRIFSFYTCLKNSGLCTYSLLRIYVCICLNLVDISSFCVSQQFFSSPLNRFSPPRIASVLLLDHLWPLNCQFSIIFKSLCLYFFIELIILTFPPGLKFNIFFSLSGLILFLIYLLDL